MGEILLRVTGLVAGYATPVAGPLGFELRRGEILEPGVPSAPRSRELTPSAARVRDWLLSQGDKAAAGNRTAA